MSKKIIITGGHLAPAVAVIEEFQKRGGWEIYFFGRKHAFEKGKFISLEYQTIKKMGIPFFTVFTPRLGRFVSFKNLFSLIKFPLSLLKQFKLLKKIKPHVILSFGGYVALPVCLAGWLMKIPIITHEQTLRPGLANRIIALFAKKILVGLKDVLSYFPKEKTKWVGNPVRKDITILRYYPPSSRLRRAGEITKLKNKLQISSEKLPFIYITGGSTGAHSINKVVVEVLPNLLMKYRLIHQCGESEYKDYEKLTAYSLRLTAELKERYLLRKYIQMDEVGRIMKGADIIVSRAGANTLSEVAVLGKPAILIPLPWAGSGEQLANAKKVEKEGAALVLREKNLNGETLSQCINSLIKNYQKYGRRAEKYSQTPQIKKHLRAASQVVDILKHLALDNSLASSRA